MRIRLFATLALSLASLVQAAPVLSAPVEVAGSRAPVAAGGMQIDLELLPGPASSLAVWADGRAGGMDVYAARLTAAGVVDRQGLLLASDVTDHGGAARGSSSLGGAWLVAWSRGNTLEGVRLGLDGLPLEPVFTIGNGLGSGHLSSDGDQYLATFTSGPTLAVRLDARGAPLEAVPLELSRPGTLNGTPSSAFSAGRWLVTWTSSIGGSYRAQGARLSAAGVVLDPVSFELWDAGATDQHPSACAMPGGWLVVWDDINGFSNDIYATTVAFDGTVGAAVQLESTAASATWPSCSFEGVNGLVTWQHEGPVHGARVLAGPPLQVLDPDGLELASSSCHGPVHLRTDAGVLMACEDYENVSNAWFGQFAVDARTTVFTTSLAAQPLRSLTTTAPAQEGGAAAFNEGAFLLAWSEQSDDLGYNLMAMRLRPDGTPLDAAPFAVSAAGGEQYAPTVVPRPGGWFVLWTEGDGPGVVGARVSSAGQVLDPGGFAVSAPAAPFASSAAARDSSSLLVVLGDHVDVGAVLASPDGGTAVLGFPHDAGVELRSPAVALSPTEGVYLVGWTEQRAADFALWVRFASGDAQWLPAPPLMVIAGDLDHESVRIVWLGDAFDVSWADHSLGPSVRFSRRVTRAGFLDAAPLRWFPPTSDENEGAVSAEGASEVLVYRDLANTIQLVHKSGPEVSAPVPLSTGRAHDPFVAGGPTHTLIGYSEAVGTESLRLRLRTWARSAGGEVCAFGYECRSGACDAGQCTADPAATGGGAGGGGSESGAGGGGMGGGAGLSGQALRVACGCADVGSFGVGVSLLGLLGARRRRSRARFRGHATPECASCCEQGFH